MMKQVQFSPLQSKDCKQMASLFEQRQIDEIKVFQFLEDTVYQKNDIVHQLDHFFNHEQTMGIGAFRDDVLIGYLFGYQKSNRSKDSIIVVPYLGLAIHQTDDELLIKMIYQEVSKLWLKNGCATHHITTPLGNKTYMNALLHLSFAYDQAYAILDVNDYKQFPLNHEIDIKKATVNDQDVLEGMSSIIQSHQHDSPVYGPYHQEVLELFKQGYRNLVTDEDIIDVWIASYDEKPAGFQVMELSEKGPMTPSDTAELSVQGTIESFRGLGIGKSLMNQGITDIKTKGYRYVSTDWVISNLTSSSFWPSCGFIPYAYRMTRTIDTRYIHPKVLT